MRFAKHFRNGRGAPVGRRFCIPHEFKLNIPHAEFPQNCRVAWRKEALIGLAF